MGVRAGVVVCVTSFLLGMSFYLTLLLLYGMSLVLQVPYLRIGLPIPLHSGKLPSLTSTFGLQHPITLS